MDDSKKYIIIYYLEDYFRVELKMTIVDFEFKISSMKLDSSIQSLIFYYKLLTIIFF